MRGMGPERTEAESALVAALVEVHRAKRRRAAERDPAGTRERILEHFERRGQRLRGERLVTSELIVRLFETNGALAPRRAQQELEIVGAAGYSAAGRLRVTNRSEARAAFELVVGDVIDGEHRPRVALSPPAGTLDPGETRLVRVEAGLWDFAAGERVTLPVECRWPTGADRLWLVILALPPTDVR